MSKSDITRSGTPAEFQDHDHEADLPEIQPLFHNGEPSDTATILLYQDEKAAREESRRRIQQ